MAQPWKRRLRPARFRNITFQIDESVYTSGRRGTTHQFPGRDVPYREDSGRRARDYKVEAFLVGPNYLSNKKKLIKALEESGPGDLIHPYYGRVRVCVGGDFNVYETVRDGGFVKISIPFVEAGEVMFPKASSDGGFKVGSAADFLSAISQGDFSAVFNVLDEAELVVDSATTKVNDFADKIDDINARLIGPAGAIADLAFAIKNLKAAATTLIETPSRLAAEIASVFSLLFDASDPAPILKSVRTMFDFGSDDARIPDTTVTRQRQATNQASTNSLIKTVAATTAAKAAIAGDYVTTEDADAARTVVTDQLDALMATTTSDEVYSALQALRAEIVKALPDETQNLARVASITPVVPGNVLAISYDLYGSLELEADIVSRNGIVHPGFVAQGAQLEVIDRG